MCFRVCCGAEEAMLTDKLPPQSCGSKHLYNLQYITAGTRAWCIAASAGGGLGTGSGDSQHRVKPVREAFF